MELVIKPFDALPCKLETFTINGKEAESEDFGFTIDPFEGDKEPGSCIDMHFESIPPKPEVLKCYNITTDEYDVICKKLEEKLCVGECIWCT